MIGSLLKDSSVLFDVAEVLKPEHFFREIHSRIFRALLEIGSTGRKPSLQQLVARIGEEYEDGKSTVHLLTSIIRDAERDDALSPFDFLEEIVDHWARRQIANAQQWIVKELSKKDKPPQLFLSEINERFQEIGLQSQGQPVKTLGDSAKRALANSMRAHETGEVVGMEWGLPTLNEVMGRILPGDLGFIGAAQGDGKTVVGLQLCRAAQRTRPVAFFQLEMEAEDMARRELAGGTDLSVSQIEEGTYDMFSIQALQREQELLSEERVYIDDRPGLTFEQFRDRCIQLKRSQNLGLVVVDHLRLLRATKRFSNKFDRVEWITGEMKVLAKTLGIAVVALSQRTRTSQRRDGWAPRLDDFDGGSSIEQDADWVLGLARPETWLKKNKPHIPAGVDPEEHHEFSKWLKEMKDHKGKIEFHGLKRRKGDLIVRDGIFDGRAGRIYEV
ncbi:replicative DNA helicase [Pseudovibrio ascidiaceicola]|uniref:replicative DNA helicase n=1 Tax=Pseudovibrio ascidiaceicola TaxID=285279 RepID=UPI003D360DFA